MNIIVFFFILNKLLRISSYPHVFLGIRGLIIPLVSCATVDLNFIFEKELLDVLNQTTGEGKVHPRTDPKAKRGNTGTALFFP